MCGGAYSPITLELWQPLTLGLLGAAAASALASGALVRHTRKRRRAIEDEMDQQTRLDASALPAASRGREVASILTALFVPTLVIGALVHGRMMTAQCVESFRGTDILYDCVRSSPAAPVYPFQQVQLLGLGALLWLPTLTLCAGSWSVARATRRALERLRWALHLSGEAHAGASQYREHCQRELEAEIARQVAIARDELRAFPWALSLFTGSTVLLAGGAMHAAQRFTAELTDDNWLYWKGSVEPYIDDSFDTVRVWSVAALVMLLAATLAAMRRVRPAPRPSMLRRGLRIASWSSGALLCVVIALPLAHRNAHPLPTDATLRMPFRTPTGLAHITPPALAGPDEHLTFGPLGAELAVDSNGALALDDQLVKRPPQGRPDSRAEIESGGLRRSLIFMRGRRSTLGIVADRRLRPEELRDTLWWARTYGQSRIGLLFEDERELPAPTLGVMRSGRFFTAADLHLVCDHEVTAKMRIVGLRSHPSYESFARAVVSIRRAGQDAYLVVGPCQRDAG